VGQARMSELMRQAAVLRDMRERWQREDSGEDA
jgi:hypothetical protein